MEMGGGGDGNGSGGKGMEGWGRGCLKGGAQTDVLRQRVFCGRLKDDAVFRVLYQGF